MDKAIEKEIQKSLKKGVKKTPLIAWLTIFCIICLCFFVYSVGFRCKAQATGGMIGESTGKLVGRAVGSLKGLTQGQIEGYEAGTEEGLSAKDTTAEISGMMKELGKLEVLVASGTYSDILTIGEDRVDYAAILSQKYNAVFTVDLKTASVELKDDELHIVLNLPEVVFVPVGEIKRIKEYQREGFFFETGSEENGWIAADNSMNELRQKAKERFQSDEAILEAAKSSAKMQISQLVSAVSLTKPRVFVEFSGGVGNA